MFGFGLACIVFHARINAVIDVSIGDVAHGIAIGRDVFRKPAPTDKKIVVQNVATSGLQSVEQLDGRLFAERPFKHDSDPVLGLFVTPAQLGERFAENGDVFLRGEEGADARQDITLNGGKILRRLSADVIEFPDQATLLVIQRDAFSQGLVCYLFAR
jgi:hypothetical protein